MEVPCDPVEIWTIALRRPAGEVRALTALLDASERGRRERLRDEDARDRYAVAHGAVRVILAERLNVRADALRWRTGRWGKPELDTPTGAPHTSLSHSGGLAVLALAWRPVGVDIERIRPQWRLKPPATLFPAGERSALAAAEPADRARLFVTLLTRKEACVKASGGRMLPDGVRLPTAGDSPLSVHGPALGDGARVATRWRVRDLPLADGYGAAVAWVGGGELRVEVHCSRSGDPNDPSSSCSSRASASGVRSSR
jgi:4'-phosphopantetheinyl transferase